MRHLTLRPPAITSIACSPQQGLPQQGFGRRQPEQAMWDSGAFSRARSEHGDPRRLRRRQRGAIALLERALLDLFFFLSRERALPEPPFSGGLQRKQPTM